MPEPSATDLSATDLSATDLAHLRRAIAIAAEAGEAGEEPYGSLLVDATGRVLAEEHNTVLSTADVTAHPELKLGRLAGRLPAGEARGCTLYTSCEPCAMCREVLARGGVGRVVFALSEEQSRAVEGPPDRQAPASIGPALFDEGIAAFGDFYGRPARPRPTAPERRFGWWNGDFDNAAADPDMVVEAWRVWRDEVAHAERVVRETPDLGSTGKEGDALRQVMVHVIEEYARHNGHADLLRERIDGRVGQ